MIAIDAVVACTEPQLTLAVLIYGIYVITANAIRQYVITLVLFKLAGCKLIGTHSIVQIDNPQCSPPVYP